MDTSGAGKTLHGRKTEGFEKVSLLQSPLNQFRPGRPASCSLNPHAVEAHWALCAVIHDDRASGANEARQQLPLRAGERIRVFDDVIYLRLGLESDRRNAVQML